MGYTYLLRSSWAIATAATVAALVSGVCATGLLGSIHYALTGGVTTLTAAGIFCLLCAGKVVSQYFSQSLGNRLAQRATTRLREILSHLIVDVPLHRLERLGPIRPLATLTDDVAVITETLQSAPNLVANLTLVALGTVYLSCLSAHVLLSLLGIALVGTAGYISLRRRAFTALRSARSEFDRLFALFRSLVEGGKEFRLYRGQREAFFEKDLRGALQVHQRHAMRAQRYFNLLEGWAQALTYFLIGLLLFGLPYWEFVSGPVLLGYVLTVLFLMRPLLAVLNLLPLLSRGRVAMANLEHVRASLSLDDKPSPRTQLFPRPDTLELNCVSYRYGSEPDSFQVGPLGLSLSPGEVVLVVGGNGSGKSTLAKLLTGLYSPHHGEVLLNGEPLSDERLDDYRQLFSAIFPDGHVFDRLPGPETPEREASARRLLATLRLNHRVRIERGRLLMSDLSQGESKRLALLSAYLEDRPFYVFDEWAANQDPQFKKIFYTEFLSELRKRGKGILVISHDDRYFSVADRLFRMEDGTISSDDECQTHFQL